jgi:hypothetical protein
LLFGGRRPTYVAFDLLIADGVDLRASRRWHGSASAPRGKIAPNSVVGKPHWSWRKACRKKSSLHFVAGRSCVQAPKFNAASA